MTPDDLRGVALKSWPVFTPFLEADKILNLPIAKHHNLTGCTLGMKNWYGILGGQRNRLHQQIHQSLADLAAFMLPTLTIMDCYRVLMRNGPTGGDVFSEDFISSYLELKWEEVYALEHTPHPIEFQMYYSS